MQQPFKGFTMVALRVIILVFLVSFPEGVHAFVIKGSVQNVRESTGTFWTYVNVEITDSTGLTGTLPDNILSLTVKRGETTLWTKNDFDFSGHAFSLKVHGAPATGTYTFTVNATNSQTTTATDSQTVNRTLPFVDINTIHVEGSTAATRTPTFFWDPVNYSGATVYYGVEIWDYVSKEQVYLSPPTNGTSFTVPDVMQAGQAYQIRVLTLDSADRVAAMNRSNSAWVYIETESVLQHASPPALSLDGYGVSALTTDSGKYYDGGICVTDLDGVSPDAATLSHSVIMETPGGQQCTLVPIEKQSNTTVCYQCKDFIGPLSEFETGEAFTFTVTDPGGNVSQITDTLPGDITALGNPSVDSFSMEENGTTPEIFWNPVSGADDYQVQIFSGDGSDTVWLSSSVHQASGSSKVFYTVPPGVLSPNTMYRYRIAASKADSSDPFDIDHISVAPRTPGTGEEFTTGTETDTPYIELGDGVSTFHSTPGGVESPRLNFNVLIYDAQGVPGNIKSVHVVFPGGHEEQLYYDTDSTDNYSIRGSYNSSPDITPVAGTHTFVVADRNGHSYSINEDLTVNDIDYPSSFTPAMNASMTATAVNFAWDAITGANYYRLRVYDENYNLVLTRNTIESSYSLPANFLKPKTLYRYDITTYRESSGENIDNFAVTKWMGSDMPTFLTGPEVKGSSSPTINTKNLGVYIDCMADPRNPGTYLYALNFEVSVADADGVPENIQSVKVTYPDNVTKRELRFDRYDSDMDAYFYYYREIMDLGSILAGKYTFSVTDRDGHAAATVTDTLTKNPLLPPTNLSPAAGATVGTTTPTFTWGAVTGASYYYVDLYEGWAGAPYRSSISLVNSVAIDTANRLKASTAYSYTVLAYREASGQDLDNRSISDYRSLTERTHFFTGTEGDVDGKIDGNGNVVNLADAIVALQVMARMKPTVYKDADVNGDGKIGLPEAIYILQIIAGLR